MDRYCTGEKVVMPAASFVFFIVRRPKQEERLTAVRTHIIREKSAMMIADSSLMMSESRILLETSRTNVWNSIIW
jgi:hypothetical protein